MLSLYGYAAVKQDHWNSHFALSWHNLSHPANPLCPGFSHHHTSERDCVKQWAESLSEREGYSVSQTIWWDQGTEGKVSIKNSPAGVNFCLFISQEWMTWEKCFSEAPHCWDTLLCFISQNFVSLTAAMPSICLALFYWYWDNTVTKWSFFVSLLWWQWNWLKK